MKIQKSKFKNQNDKSKFKMARSVILRESRSKRDDRRISTGSFANAQDDGKAVNFASLDFARDRFCILHFAFARKRAGFTLLEVIVSSGLFAVIMIIAVGAVLSLSQAELKARKLQSIQDNLRFALESMTKELRTGANYCASYPSCVSGSAAADLRFFSVQQNGEAWYCLQGGAIRKLAAPSGGQTCQANGSPVTSSDITIEKLTFYVIGSTSGPSDGQPRVTVTIRAKSTDPKLETKLNLQTTVTARTRDQ